MRITENSDAHHWGQSCVSFVSRGFSSVPMIFLECRGKLFRVRSKNFSSAVEKVLGCVLEKGCFVHYLCFLILWFLRFRVSGCQNADVQRAAPCFYRVTRVTGGWQVDAPRIRAGYWAIRHAYWTKKATYWAIRDTYWAKKQAVEPEF